jgi:hypothetical protein
MSESVLIAEERRCRVCKNAMPLEVRRCGSCGAFQKGWRRMLFYGGFLTQLATLLTILATFHAISSYVANYHSRTRFAFTRATEKEIAIHVWNTGQPASRFLGGRLKFGDVEIHDLDLAVAAGSAANVIIGQTAVMIELVAAADVTPRGGETDLRKALRGKNVTLEVDVEESNDPARGFLWRPPRDVHRYQRVVSGDSLVEFIVQNYPQERRP